MNPEIKAKFDSATDQQKALMKRAAQQVAERLAKPKTDQPDPQPNETKKATFSTVSASFRTSPTSVYSLNKSFLLDSGSTHHIINDRSRFLTYEPADQLDTLIAGDHEVQIHGYGTGIAYAHGSAGKAEMYLQNAIYIPSFHTNLISFRRMKKGGFSWDTDRNTLIKDGSEFCSVTDIKDQFIIKYQPVSDADIQ